MSESCDQKEVVLLDTDFHQFADDHEALVMLLNLHRRQQIELVGITTVTGNTWAHISKSHAEAVVRLREMSVPVVQGALRPLVHSKKSFEQESALYGAMFAGAWGRSSLLNEGTDDHRVRIVPDNGKAIPGAAAEKTFDQPPDSGAEAPHAVAFIIDTIRSSQTPITIVAIGPMTNLALAVRLAPDIVSGVRRIVCMGGAFKVPGNTTPVAEFNWWFDAESAEIVLGESWPVEIVPLDATDRILLDLPRYDKWRNSFGNTTIFRSFHQQKFDGHFSRDAGFSIPVWDALVPALLQDGSVAQSEMSCWVRVNHNSGPDYGRVSYVEDEGSYNLTTPDRPKSRVILEFNASRFWNLYEELVFAE